MRGHIYAFTSPSGNITCGVFLQAKNDGSGFKVAKWGKAEMMGCVIREHSYKPHQKDCQADATFYLNYLRRTGKAQRLGCSGDMATPLYGLAMPEGAQPLRLATYGSVINVDVARCRVERRYVTCTNSDDHGFKISRTQNRQF